MIARWPRWLLPLVLAVAMAWVIEHLSADRRSTFMRIPVGHGPAPAWTMPDLDGNRIDSTNFLGKIVVLNFWATWCPPCRQEIPELNAFQLSHTNDGVTVIGASVDDGGAEAVRPFVRRMKVAYPVVLADALQQSHFGGASVGPLSGGMSLPTTLVIDRQGNFVARFLGALTQKELDSAISPLFSASH